MYQDLVVDCQIRSWVFLPIVLITFLVGILRHFISLLLISEKKNLTIYQLRDSQIIARARALRQNGHFIPKSSFLLRKEAFNKEGNGYLTRKRFLTDSNPMADPSFMTDMLKGNLSNMLPMVIIGGWINWTFSGFITTKVPFPLTLKFKPMLQRGIELQHLDASWVSSASWYFLNVFGLRSIYNLILGENNGADQTSKHLEEQIAGPAIMPNDPKEAFKAEWENLEMFENRWALKGIESTFCSKK